MYGIFTYIYHKCKPNESKYPIHWASGLWILFYSLFSLETFGPTHLLRSDLEDNDSQTISCVSLRILVSPKEGISPIILFWGWDWNPQSYSREVSGVLGSVFQVIFESGFHHGIHHFCPTTEQADVRFWTPKNQPWHPFTTGAHFASRVFNTLNKRRGSRKLLGGKWMAYFILIEKIPMYFK